jgi:hypothetical protein
MADREVIGPSDRAAHDGTPASAALAWLSTADDDWLRAIRSYDGFVRHRRSD